jgi:alpha-L-fucosidase
MGLVNNRFTQEFRIESEAMDLMGGKHFDFTTPEYASYDEITEPKWEATRGIGYSFGYNRNEDINNYLSVEELVRSFVDIVSKNGNLLLNVGPKADGTIPKLQQERLMGLGAWLEVNGDAIFDTRPWTVAEGTAGGEVPLRFTQKAETLYAVALDAVSPGELALDGLVASDEAEVRLLGCESPLAYRQRESGVVVTIPEGLPDSLVDAPAFTLAISPQPQQEG